MTMKTTVLFSALCMFSSGLSQKVLSENLGPKVKVYWDSDNKKLHSTGCYYTDDIRLNTSEKHGKWLFYSTDGVLEEERYYYRNRVHGKQTVFFANKTIKQVSYAKFNLPDSVFKEYDDKGTLLIHGAYDLGLPTGKWSFYYSDSSLWKEELVSNDTTYLMSYFLNDEQHTQTVAKGNGTVVTYFQSGGVKESYSFLNGLRNGPFFEQLASGVIAIKGEFLDGKKHGKWSFNYPDGALEKRQEFVADSLEGEYLVLYPNGIVQTEGKYKLGKKQGPWIWRMQDGNLEMTGSFDKDLQDGDWTYYFSSGELSYNAHYAKGLKSGFWEYFYKDGQSYRNGSFVKDLKEGRWQTWYEDGTLLMTGNYHLGKEVGNWKNYWPNGRVKNQAYYSSGKLNGAWYSFTPEGKLHLFGRYKKDLKKGKWTEFYANGMRKEERTYAIKKVKNQANDVVALGFKDLRSVEHGNYRAYSQVDYTVKESGKYASGNKVGKWTNFYPGGIVPAVVTNYKKGQLHGMFSQYDRRGNKMNEIHYKKGLKDGWLVVYGRNGEPIVKKRFSKGIELQRLNAQDMFAP